MLQRASDGGRKPSGLDQLLQRDQRSPSEDNHGGGGFCSSTVPALDEHLEEKQRLGFQFEKEKGARRERLLLLHGGSEGFGRGTVPRYSWGVLPHPSYLTAFGAGTDRLWLLGKLLLPTSPVLTQGAIKGLPKRPGCVHRPLRSCIT